MNNDQCDLPYYPWHTAKRFATVPIHYTLWNKI